MLAVIFLSVIIVFEIVTFRCHWQILLVLSSVATVLRCAVYPSPHLRDVEPVLLTTMDIRGSVELQGETHELRDPQGMLKSGSNSELY
ncbi:hypothetical protein BDZ97DRAFT_118381 [Flammula alnicola]|nr:hypothetical protein BDZ97DRAFT_118381 [Flammula alnicola]